MGKYFGTDGFRGEANVVLTVEHAFKVGRYLGWYFGQDHKARIVIGKDYVEACARRLNPQIKIFYISAKTGDGVRELADYLLEQVQKVNA